MCVCESVFMFVVTTAKILEEKGGVDSVDAEYEMQYTIFIATFFGGKRKAEREREKARKKDKAKNYAITDDNR